MTLDQQIIVEALAFADALFEPLRSPRSAYWAAVWSIREHYPSRGLPWRAGGSKEHERALTEAVGAGWLTRRRAQRKTTGIKLTPLGLTAAWKLTGVGSDTAAVATGEVDRLGPKGSWVRETAFTGGKGWGDGHQAELKQVAVFRRPALTIGWIQTNCDIHGRVGYRTTRAGRAALKRSVLATGDEPEPPEPEQEILDAYRLCYSESLHWLDSQTNISVDNRGDIGAIPLSASIWADSP